jgi:parallel beta-helix repeat protein
MNNKLISIGLVWVIVVGGFFAFINFESDPARAAQSHDPITIDGNEDFNMTNGLRGGSGTLSDPFRIERWEIDASTFVGIRILNTDAHFVIDNVYIYSGESYCGIFFYNVTNGCVKNSELTENKYGIYLNSSVNIEIKNNEITNNEYDIFIDPLVKTNITGNKLWYNTYGVHITSCQGLNIMENEVAQNEDGIYLNSADYNRIDGNTLSDNMNGVFLEFSHNNLIINNTGSFNKKAVYLKSSHENMITGNSAHSEFAPYSYIAIVASDSNNTIISNNDVSEGWRGISLGSCNNITIKNNLVCYLFINNSVNDNRVEGIYTSKSQYINITDNEFHDNFYGIELDTYTNTSIVVNNEFSNNIYGILPYKTSFATIESNRISNNDKGIYLRFSNNITITNNSIWKNDYGIHYDESENVTVYHNDFIENEMQVYSNTKLNLNVSYPTGGNYWSNYTESDLFKGINQDLIGSDGIGDTSFIIDNYSMDSYPLMTPCTYIIPLAPHNVQIGFGDRLISLIWNPPNSSGSSSIVNYIIFKRSSKEEEASMIEIGNVSFYNDTNVTNGMVYYYRICAENSMGRGPLSLETQGISATVPSSPINLTVTAGYSYIDLAWIAPDSDGGSSVTNYRIFRGYLQDNLTFLIEINNTTYYRDTEVSNGMTYYYKVCAQNAIGEGTPSTGTNSTLITESVVDFESNQWIIIGFCSVIAVTVIIAIYLIKKRKY